MKGTIVLASLVCLTSISMGQATFYRLGIQNSQVTDCTPDGKYAAAFVGANYVRWEIGVGSQTIAGSHSGGSAYISDNGQRIGGEALDGSAKRHAGYYDMSTASWNLAPQPAGYTTVGLGSTLSTMYGMDGTGTKLAVASYDAGLKYKPIKYDTNTWGYSTNPTLSTSHARPNDMSADGSTMAGWDSNPSTRQAAVWKNGVEVFVETGLSEIQGVNSNGSEYYGYKGNSPVVWNSTFSATVMPLLAGFDRGGVAFGTDDGVAQVGYMQNGTNTGTRRGVIWINGLPQLLSTYAESMGATLNGFIPLAGMRITNNGHTIVGFGQTSTNQIDSFAIQIVPEPASISSMVGAGFAFVLLRRKKKQAIL